MHPDEIRQRAQAIEFVQGGGQQRSRAGSPEPARGPGDAVAAGHAGALHALLAAVDGAAAGALAAAECLDDAPVDRQFLQDQADDAVIGLQRDLLEPGEDRVRSGIARKDKLPAGQSLPRIRPEC